MGDGVKDGYTAGDGVDAGLEDGTCQAVGVSGTLAKEGETYASTQERARTAQIRALAATKNVTTMRS